jgi:hypothetical protein
MLVLPQKGLIRHQHNWGTVGASPFGTSVTTGASSSTKGSATQLIASTDFDAYWIEVFAADYDSDVNASQGCMDILIGSVTEEVLIPDLLMGYCSGPETSRWTTPKTWAFPLYIPAGSRISARAAGVRTSTSMRVGVRLIGGSGSPNHRVGRKVTTYGMGTVPDGTSITPGASGAEGSWVQMTASTSEDHFALFPSFQLSGDGSTNVRSLFVDLGVGAATEEEVAQSYVYLTDDNELMCGPIPNLPCFCDIPAGSRLVMRASNSGANDGGYNGVIHAVS